MTNQKTKIGAMRTEILSDMVTQHARKIAAIRENERIRVVNVEGDADVTRFEGVVN